MSSSAAAVTAALPGDRTPAARTVVAVGGACCAIAALIAYLGASNGVDDIQIALLEWITVPYVVAGLVAWRRRPDSRLGLLMIAGGFASGISAFQFSQHPHVSTLGALFDILAAAVFLHVYLAFPDGRLSSTLERALVILAYATSVGLQFVKIALGRLGPDNPLVVSNRPGVAETVEQAQLLSISAICVIAVAVLLRRQGSPTRRRSLAAVIDSFALGLLMIAVLFAIGALGSDSSLFRPIQRAMLTVIGIAPFAFLIGLLDARLARSAVGQLVIDLGRHPTPTDLRDALARALRDPALTVAYWLPEYATYADLEGRPVALDALATGRATRLIERDGVRVAAIVHDHALEDEPELLDAVVAAAAIALENGQLHAELKARLEELAGSRARVIEAGHKERQRLERNLHDGAQQRLIALSLELSMLEKRLGDDAEARQRLEDAQREIAQSLEELRDVARGLHPAVVTGHGLAVALEQVAARAHIPVELRIDLRERLPEQTEVAAYYVVTESLTNVTKHAHATSSQVAVSRLDGRLIVEVTDDGVGGADSERGSGLRGLADRVEALGGRLRVWTPVGGGTRVRAEFPCA